MREKHINLRIQDYAKDLEKYRPEAKLLAIKQKFATEETRRSISRATKFEIDLANRRKREEDLEVKLRRFEWRMKSDEISAGKVKWTRVVCAIGTLKIMIQKFKVRKVKIRQSLHYRSEGVLKFLLLMAISVGKICRIVKQKRRKSALRTLKRMVPLAMRWMKFHKLKMSEKIVETIENCLSKDAMIQMIAAWKSKVIGM